MQGSQAPTQIPRAQRGQVLILLIGFMFLGAGAGGSLLILGGKTPKEVGKQVATLESDATRRERVDNALAYIKQEAERLDSERSRLEKDTLKALRRHDTTLEELRALSTRADALNADSSKTLIELRFMLRRQLTDSQWSAIFAVATPSQK